MIWYGLVAYDAFTTDCVGEFELDDGLVADTLQRTGTSDYSLHMGCIPVPKADAEDLIMQLGVGLPLGVDWFLEAHNV